MFGSTFMNTASPTSTTMVTSITCEWLRCASWWPCIDSLLVTSHPPRTPTSITGITTLSRRTHS